MLIWKSLPHVRWPRLYQGTMKNGFPVEFPLSICFEAHVCLPLVSALSFLQGNPEFHSSRRSLSSALVDGQQLAFKGGCKWLTRWKSGQGRMGGSIPISQTGRLMTVNELCCCPQTLTILTSLIIPIAHVYGSANHQSKSWSGLSKAPSPSGPSRKERSLLQPIGPTC